MGSSVTLRGGWLPTGHASEIWSEQFSMVSFDLDREFHRFCCGCRLQGSAWTAPQGAPPRAPTLPQSKARRCPA